MSKIRPDILAWRRRQKKHSIMQPEEFNKIAASSGGGEKGKRIAGRAYWNRVKSKYRKSK